MTGLGGHAFGSFKSHGKSHMWLCDSLPDDLPNARIILYGYDTGMAHSRSFQSLEGLASTLTSTLQMLLAKEEPQQKHRARPLIFIAHSLGGLVFKEALIQMKNDRNSYDLLGYIYGVLFFWCTKPGHGHLAFTSYG